jgi:sigma-B regulation protein RsbU (phosphoserine phosphatase)
VIRPRLSLSGKLIAFAVVLVATLTVSFVVVATNVLEEAYVEQGQRLRSDRISELQRRSLEVARNVGATAREALAGSETGRLQRIVREIAQSATEIENAAFADESGRVLVRSDMLVLDALKAELSFVAIDSGGPVVAERQLQGKPVREITYPISSPAGILGYLQLSWSLEPLHIELLSIERQRDRNVEKARDFMIGAGLVAIAAGILAGILGGIRLARPIRRLARTARSIAQGDLSARSQVRTGDEIEELSSTMNYMAEQISELVDEVRDNAELEQELAVARGIQHALLPNVGMIEQPGLHLSGLVEPASHCGGDWWAYLKLTRQRTLILVGDVTGHGISSAMVTATARSCLDTVGQLTRGDFRVGYLLEIMDQLLREGIGGEYHMTCFASIVDPLEGTMTYANAGHNHPYLLRRTDDGWRTGRLSARGNRLGDADGYAFVEHTINMTSRDLLCWYTDGLVETEDHRGRQFGDRRLRAALSGAADGTPEAVLDQIMTAFHDHRGEQPLSDDVTCVVGRIVS